MGWRKCAFWVEGVPIERRLLSPIQTTQTGALWRPFEQAWPLYALFQPLPIRDQVDFRAF